MDSRIVCPHCKKLIGLNRVVKWDKENILTENVDRDIEDYLETDKDYIIRLEKYNEGKQTRINKFFGLKPYFLLRLLVKELSKAKPNKESRSQTEIKGK